MTPHQNSIFQGLTLFENSEKEGKCLSACHSRKQTTMKAAVFKRIIYETDILKQN